MSDPVHVARAQLGRATQLGDAGRVAQAREDLDFAHLERAIRTYAPKLSEHYAGRATSLLAYALDLGATDRRLAEMARPDAR